jgi:hypothetical protein
MAAITDPRLGAGIEEGYVPLAPLLGSFGFVGSAKGNNAGGRQG